MEVEILVAEVGRDPGGEQMFHIEYDGTVSDERRYAALGGDAEAIAGRMEEAWAEGMTLAAAIQAASRALAGPERTLLPEDLEVALLARTNGRRCFRRLDDETVAELLRTG
jgi:proteasome alpha subunit